MILKVLFLYRKDGAAGQYVPEAVEVIDKYSFDEYPDAFLKRAEHYKQPEVVSMKIIDIDLGKGSDQAIHEILGGTPKISGTIVKPRRTP